MIVDNTTMQVMQDGVKAPPGLGDIVRRFTYLAYTLVFLAGVQAPAVRRDGDAQSVRERGEQRVCRPGGGARPRSRG